MNYGNKNGNFKWFRGEFIMGRGWEVELKDGTILNENELMWKEVPKVKIKRLSLLFDNRRWDLEDKDAYFVNNRVSMVPGIAASMVVEQRCIGYYEGAKKIYYIVDEPTGRFHMKVVNNGAI